MRKVNKKVKSQDRIIKTIIVVLCYFLYSQAFESLFGNSYATKFIADVIFMVGIFLAYKDNIKEDVSDIKKNYKKGKIIKTIIIWFFIIFFFNILMGALTDAIIPNASNDDNTNAIYALYNVSPIYAIFKCLVFGVVAEELLFRESIHDVIKSKWAFIFASAIIYTLVNFAYTDFSDKIIIVSMLSYFLPALIFSYAYYKNNSNIIILMLIKLTYNLLIPFMLMITGAGA